MSFIFPARDAEASLAFAVLSDLHMTHRGEGLQKLSQHLALYARVTPKIDAHVFAGDIIYQHDLSGGGACDTVYTEPYEYLKMALDRYASDLPLIYAVGNHEYPQNRHDEEIMAEARRVHTSYGYPLRSHTVVNGYHFVQFGLQSWARDVRPEDETWMMHEVRCALRSSGDKPVFAVLHAPLPGTVYRSSTEKYSDQLVKFLLSSRRIVTICGHKHTTVEHPYTIWQRKGGGTVIHAPLAAVGNLGLPGVPHRTVSTLYTSRSLFFEVKGTDVLIHKIDNLAEKEIGSPWVVHLTGEQYYTDLRCKKAKKPYFPQDTRVSTSFVPGGILFRFSKALCEKTAGHDDGIAPSYRFDFYAKGEKEPAHTCLQHCDYYTSYPGEEFERVLAPTLPKGEYRVKITPISFFGKEGRPLRTKIRMPEALPSALHDPHAKTFAMV